MKNVPTGWDLSDLSAISKGFHTDHALRGIEFVDFFDILEIFDDWYHSVILVYEGHMSQSVPVLSVFPSMTCLISYLIPT